MTALPVFRGVSAFEMCTLAPMVLAADAWARRAPFRKAPCSDVFVRLRVSQIHSRCEQQLTERLAGEHAVFETERAMLVRERERLAVEVRSALCVLRVVPVRLLSVLWWDPLVPTRTCRRCYWNKRARCVCLSVFMIGVKIPSTGVCFHDAGACTRTALDNTGRIIPFASRLAAGYPCLQFRWAPTFLPYHDGTMCWSFAERPGLPRACHSG